MEYDSICVDSFFFINEKIFVLITVLFFVWIFSCVHKRISADRTAHKTEEKKHQKKTETQNPEKKKKTECTYMNKSEVRNKKYIRTCRARLENKFFFALSTRIWENSSIYEEETEENESDSRTKKHAKHK